MREKYEFFKIINGGELHLKILSFLALILHSSTSFSQLQVEVHGRLLSGTTLKVKKRKPPVKKKNQNNVEYEKHLRTAKAGEGRPLAWVPTQVRERQLEEMKNLK